MRRYFGMFIKTKYKSGKGSNPVLETFMETLHNTEQVSYGMFEIEVAPDVTVRQIAEDHRKQLIENARKSMESEHIGIDDVDIRIVELF
ncbi:hypothetical protein [Pyramidobacter piscolens]|uniref:hypothetical protein n=1 Tax=Pyramidobacter piscolens TaxID=638849 RepID=UPI002492B158|nr:hypothetical protein [Pyramidobacter piscolens]